MTGNTGKSRTLLQTMNYNSTLFTKSHEIGGKLLESIDQSCDLYFTEDSNHVNEYYLLIFLKNNYKNNQ